MHHGHAAVAHISGGAVDDVPDPRIRQRWNVHFPVPDLEETIAAAKEGEG
ncbi:hypothetical protein GCM10010222_12190 [Streptomyces tanashiensis]|nr:hypothetical protein GCM10010222_12190 [Streptomyces tanashiensis]